jgi:hypothetical protein
MGFAATAAILMLVLQAGTVVPGELLGPCGAAEVNG